MSTRAHSRIVVAFVGLLGATSLLPAQNVELLGDLSKAEFRGLEQMKVADVRRVLEYTSQFWVAATPSRPLSELLSVMRTHLLLAFQADGFRDARVEVSVPPESGRLVIQIHEGQRWTAGGIRIAGTRAVDAQRLEAHLLHQDGAEKRPLDAFGGGLRLETWFRRVEYKKPIWREGSPAPFDAAAREALVREVRHGLARQGFFASKVSVDVEVEEGLALLMVRFADEGPRSVLGHIEVEGALRNRPAGVIDYLALQEGTVADADLLYTVRDKLWRSARFWSHRLTLVPDENPARATLQIELREHEQVPRLQDPLGAAEQAMLRCQDWSERNLATAADFVMEIRRPRWLLQVLMGREGAVLRLDESKLATPDSAPEHPLEALLRRLRSTLVLTPRRVSFHAPATRGQPTYEWPVPPLIVGWFELVPSLDPGELSKFWWNLVLTTKRRPGGPPVEVSLQLAPVCFLDLLREEGAATTVVDGVFTLQTAKTTCRFESESGRLIELIWRKDQNTLRLASETGALEREVLSLHKAAAGNENERSSPGAFVAATLAHSLAVQVPDSTRQAAAASVLRKLLLPYVSSVLEELASSHKQPFDPVMALAAPILALFDAMSAVDRCWPRGSWPWTVVRQSILVLMKLDQGTGRELDRLYRSDIGPIGCLAIAGLAAWADETHIARPFALLGLERCQLESFVADCRVLSEGEARWLLGLVASLRVLEDDELDALSPLVGAEGATILELMARSPKGEGREADTLPRSLLEAVWASGARELLDGALRRIAERR